MPKKKGTPRKYPPRRSIKKQITNGGAGPASSLPREPYNFIHALRSGLLFYRAGDYLTNLTDDKMRLCKNNYMWVIMNTVIQSLTTLGFERARNGSITDEYMFTFLNLPLCWQEIVILLYLSLKMHRLVENNSRVVSLGESPSKLVFIQELLSRHPSYNPVLEKYGFATNVEYTFFPASRLMFSETQILDPNHDISTYIRRIDEHAMRENDRSFGAPRWDDILSHFTLFKMDPMTIITEGKNIYIQDRCEGYTSICRLLQIYNKLCYIQRITQEQRLELFERLYILGFDSKNLLDDARNQRDRIKIERVNIFFYQIITKQRIDPTPDKYHFIQQNFFYSKNYSLPDDPTPETLRSNGFNIFMSQHYLLIKMIRCLTMPEDSFNSVRCIMSCGLNDRGCVQDIKKNHDEHREFHIREPAPLGTNCNLVNFCLMMFIHELGDEYIENLILSLDTINEDILFYSNDHTFDTLNDEISEFINQQPYNGNILNNVSINKEVIEKISEKIGEFLKRDGLFSPCRYMPFTFQKKRPNKGKSRRRRLGVSASSPLQLSSPSPSHTPTRRQPPRQRSKPSP